MGENKNEIILFEDGDVKLEVNMQDETVWLNRQQLSELFERDIKTIGKHINNALKEELKDIPTVANFATVQKEGQREVTRNIEYYNLDMILSVGYRVKSSKGISFRKWATKVLKEYTLKGYAVNQRRLEYLEKTMLLLLEEVGELAKSIRKNATDMCIDNNKVNHYDTIESEVADVFIVLNSVCNKLNIDLYKALKDKEKENIKRTWKKEE